MRRWIVAPFVTLLVALAGLPSLSQASAATAPTAVISPADGSTVLTGFRAFQVRLTDEPAGAYFILVRGCGSAYYEYRDFTADGTNRTYALDLPALTCADFGYSASLWRGSSDDPDAVELVDNYFYVEAPEPLPVIDTFTVTPQVIYPTVQDGYKDSAVIDWMADNLDNRGRVDIINAAGLVVATQAGSTGYWDWSGRTANGGRVKPGRYRVRLTLRNAQNKVVWAVKPLTVRRAYAPATFTYDYYGTATSSRSHRGNCSITGYDGDLTLDCWAGKYAMAQYAFRVPAKAHNFKWSVRGGVNCCSNGRIIKSAKRVSKRRYVITVKVTNWRSYAVRSVHLKYDCMAWWRPQAR